MQIIVNGEPKTVAAGKSLKEILDELNVRQDIGFAVALNATVVPRSELAETVVHDGDRLEIIQATTGG